MAAIALFTTVHRAPAQAGWGAALQFDGVDAFVRIPNFGSAMPTNEVTVEFWLKVETLQRQVAFALEPDQPTDRYLAHVPWLTGVVYWDFGNNADGGRPGYTPPVAITNGWHHFALVASRSGNAMRIYRNGLLETNQTGSQNFTRGTYDLLLGGNTNYCMHGQMDEFRIWNVARSAANIQDGMRHALLGSEAGLMAYWKFDEGAGSATADATGHGHTGILTNGTAWASSTVPQFPPSVSTLAVSGVGLDGTNGAATLNGWVNPKGLPTTAWFEWGPNFNYGQTTAVTNLGSGVTPMDLSSVLTSLTPGMRYQYRVVAINSAGLARGAATPFWIPAPAWTPAPTRGSVTLNGHNPMTNECHAGFVDPGATVSESAPAIAAGRAHSLALRANGTVVGWGDNGDGQTTIPTNLNRLNLSIAVSGTMVTNTPSIYTLTYRTTNSLGAVAAATRTEVVADTLPPELTLLGENPLMLELGAPFTDPGATASDLCTGDLTGSIVTNLTVNPNFAGACTNTFTVTDVSGNLAATNRLVLVVTRPVLTGLEHAGDGAFQFTFTSTRGACFNMLTTTNLALPTSEWTVLGPATESPPGHFQFTDVTAMNQPQRFYRLRWP